MELAKEEAGCIGIPRILLPREADIYTWAVIACDQFTGDAAYWKNVEELTRGKYSTYHLIYPEIYLKSGRKERTEAINKAMARYLEEGVFKECEEGFILTERTFGGRVRTGIMLAVDLESYSFRVGDGALIRSTEETVEDRLPPRVDIRRGAALELPHIMLLYDDPEFKVLSAAERGDILYDSRLNMGGGSIKGTFIKNSRQVRDARRRRQSFACRCKTHVGGSQTGIGRGEQKSSSRALCTLRGGQYIRSRADIPSHTQVRPHGVAVRIYRWMEHMRRSKRRNFIRRIQNFASFSRRYPERHKAA